MQKDLEPQILFKQKNKKVVCQGLIPPYLHGPHSHPSVVNDDGIPPKLTVLPNSHIYAEGPGVADILQIQVPEGHL